MGRQCMGFITLLKCFWEDVSLNQDLYFEVARSIQILLSKFFFSAVFLWYFSTLEGIQFISLSRQSNWWVPGWEKLWCWQRGGCWNLSHIGSVDTSKYPHYFLLCLKQPCSRFCSPTCCPSSVQQGIKAKLLIPENRPHYTTKVFSPVIEMTQRNPYRGFRFP